jgi:hypothetical protein
MTPFSKPLHFRFNGCGKLFTGQQEVITAQIAQQVAQKNLSWEKLPQHTQAKV